MNQNKISIWVLLISLVSCTPKWDDHYDVAQATVTDKTVWEYLQASPEYSKFVSLVKETGVDEILESGDDVTVWAPTNDRVLDLSGMDDSVKILTVKNHISNLSYTSEDMLNGIRLSSLSGKKIGIYSDDNVSFKVNDCRIVKSDMICRNGVVQEISGWLNLQDNLKDYLENAIEYSILRELIHEVTDSVFDLENSTPTGELDVMGRPVYDSVFKQINSFYNAVPLDNENRLYTLFLTPDWVLQEEIEKHYQAIISYRGAKPTGEDTTKLENWLRNSIPYSGSYYDFTGIERMNSVRGVTWQPSYQVLGGHREFSNGTVWQVTDLHIPNTLIWKSGDLGIDYVVSTIWTHKRNSISLTVTGLDPDVEVANAPVYNTPSAADGLQVTVSPIELTNTQTYNIELDWTIGDLSEGNFKQITLLPGEYMLEFYFKKTEDMKNDFELYLNDRFVALYHINEYPTTGTVYSVVHIVEIGQEFAETPTRLTLKTVGGSGQAVALSAQKVKFRQTANNY